MTISVASAAECGAFAVKTLDLDSTRHDLFSAEGLAASLRRAASFLCPATPRQLVDAVLDAVRPLRPFAPPSRQDAQDMLELLVSAGDLIEMSPTLDGSTRLLFLGPPSYVEKHSGRYLVMGIRPYGEPLVGPGTPSSVDYDRQTRSIQIDPSEGAKVLQVLGLQRISRERWAAEPERLAASELVAHTRSRLDVARAAGNVPELNLLDPAAKVTYYSGRWREVRPQDSGDFVARRPQEYGSPLWCAVRIEDGKPVRLIDFPLDDITVPGRDEAWRLQAAIDASRATPQIFRVSTAPSDDVTETKVDFNGPVPSWAQRYLDLVGAATDKAPGSLFSYTVPRGALADLTSFLGRTLWMGTASTGGAL